MGNIANCRNCLFNLCILFRFVKLRNKKLNKTQQCKVGSYPTVAKI